MMLIHLPFHLKSYRRENEKDQGRNAAPAYLTPSALFATFNLCRLSRLVAVVAASIHSLGERRFDS